MNKVTLEGRFLYVEEEETWIDCSKVGAVSFEVVKDLWYVEAHLGSSRYVIQVLTTRAEAEDWTQAFLRNVMAVCPSSLSDYPGEPTRTEGRKPALVMKP